MLARCPLTLHLWRRADRNPATLPDDSASVPALQSIDRLLCSSQSMAQLLTPCSSVVLLLSQGFETAHFRKSDVFSELCPEHRFHLVADVEDEAASFA